MLAPCRLSLVLAALLLAASPIVAAAASIDDRRPAPGTVVGSDHPSIFARFDGSTPVDPSTVRVTLDGADVTRSATIASTYVSYTSFDRIPDGRHNVAITGIAEDGSAISSNWWFGVDTFANGFGGFGPFAPGFSLFVPGPLFFVAENVILVVLVSEFFPLESGFVTIGGLPGTFPFVSWPGRPGFFFSRVRVPNGVIARAARVSAHVDIPQVGTMVVRGGAPVMIDSTRTTLPSTLRYAVPPPSVPRLEPAGVPRAMPVPPHAVALPPGYRVPVWSRPATAGMPPRSVHWTRSPARVPMGRLGVWGSWGRVMSLPAHGR